MADRAKWLFVDSAEGTFCVSTHDRLGIVVYDEAFQQGLSAAWCRLYVAAETRFGTFVRGRVRDELPSGPVTEQSFPDAAALNRVITQYATLKPRIAAAQRRVTYCHSCVRSLHGWDFPVCLECLWLKCSCGSCGCNRTAPAGGDD